MTAYLGPSACQAGIRHTPLQAARLRSAGTAYQLSCVPVMKRLSHPPCQQRGFTLLEMLVVLVMVSVLLGSAVSNLKQLNRPLQNATAQSVGFFKRVRARAISTTSAYMVFPASEQRLASKYGSTCSDTDMTVDPDMELTLPSDVRLVYGPEDNPDWSICFNSRGIAQENLSLRLRDESTVRGTRDQSLRVFLGGAVRILEPQS